MCDMSNEELLAAIERNMDHEEVERVDTSELEQTSD